jgi:hypothetical protein
MQKRVQNDIPKRGGLERKSLMEVFSVSLAMQKGCKMTPPNEEDLRERA